MIPLLFGSGSAPLYGVYHPAAEPRKRRGALILNPWGWEALRAHRTLRMLAERLAGKGYDVLRFDYFGTGDSAGENHEVSWARWLDDAGFAMDELKVLASVQRVTVVGLRVGGLLATGLLGRRSRDMDRVVLWAAPRSGAEALEWMDAAPPGERSAYPAPDRFRDEVRGVFPGPGLEGFRGHLIRAGTPELPFDDSSLRSQLRIDPPDHEPPCWKEDRDHGAGAVPVDLLERIVGAME